MQLSPSQTQYNYRRVHRLIISLGELMAQYGYEVVETPIIEAADLFLTKAGDQIVKKLFTFERHGQELALRPEFTAPAAYYYVNRPNNTGQHAVRWQFNGPVFEDDPHDLGHNYQRFSIGAELIGLDGPMAEAEIIGMAAQGVLAQGVSDLELLIGHAGLTRQVLARFNLDARTERFLLSRLPVIREVGKSRVLEELGIALREPTMLPQTPSAQQDAELQTYQVVSALLDSSQRGTTMGSRTREDITRRLLQKRKRRSEYMQVEAALELLESWVCIEAPPDEAFIVLEALVDKNPTVLQTIEQWRSAVNLLRFYDVPPNKIKIQPALARSWEYYTGIVFELRTITGLHLGGGGRYDELVRLIGSAHNVPAVGFAYYVDEMLNAITNHTTAQQLVVLVLASGSQDIAATQWAHQLRLRGITAILTPEGQNNKGGHVLVIVEPGNVHLRDSIYELSQVDALVSLLREIKNEQ